MAHTILQCVMCTFACMFVNLLQMNENLQLILWYFTFFSIENLTYRQESALIPSRLHIKIIVVRPSVHDGRSAE